jgi:amino-acid N-acetyltransferase
LFLLRNRFKIPSRPARGFKTISQLYAMIELIRADARNHPDLVALLRQVKLPAEDLPAGLPHFFLGYRNDELIASAGLELYGAVALLRSVAVLPEFRGRGIGNRLFDKAFEHAASQGVRELWLITDTAGAYFEKMEFQRVERSETHPAIAGTAQFNGICPGSAAVMRRFVYQNNGGTTANRATLPK